MVALHEAQRGGCACYEDGALNSFRAPYTIAAQSAVRQAAHRAWERGDDIVLPMHLLEVLLGHAPVRDVIQATGTDPDRILASIQAWRDDDERRRSAGVSGHAYRVPASARKLPLASSDAFELVVDDGILSVAPDKPVDSLALLLSLLAREIDDRGLIAHLLARPIVPGPRSFLLASGIRWDPTIRAVHKRRDSLGRDADVPFVVQRAPDGLDVVLVNDDATSFDFVVSTLREVFQLTDAQAWFVTLTIDQRGEAVVAHVDAAAGAELVTRIESRARAAGFPLVATVRPAK